MYRLSISRLAVVETEKQRQAVPGDDFIAPDLELFTAPSASACANCIVFPLFGPHACHGTDCLDKVDDTNPRLCSAR